MFVSDIHGFSDKLDLVKCIYDAEKPNKIVFLGDLFYGYDQRLPYQRKSVCPNGM